MSRFELLLLVLLVILLGIGVLLRVFVSRPQHPPSPGATVQIKNAIFKVDVASTTLTRAQGLSGREGLREDTGMIFDFGTLGNYGFWMKDMNFPLDILWIHEGKVAGFAENVQPEPGKKLWQLHIYYPPEPVDKVLEVNAGTVVKYHIQVNDPVAFLEEK